MTEAHKIAVTAEQSRTAMLKFIDTAREAILIVDAGMRIVVANGAARRAFSRVTEAIEGRRLSEVLREAALHKAFQRALTGGWSTDLKIEFIGRATRNYDVRVGPIEFEGAQNAVGVFYDITELERLERVRQEFLSNISHELRTPLTSILAFVETLEDGGIDDKNNNRRFLEVIRRNAERMRALIADILELSMIETGKVIVDTREIKLARIVSDVFASLSAGAALRSVTLVSRVPPDACITADPVRVEQMLTNLIDNAIKFNRTGGSVTVTLDRKGEKNLVSVADTGEGIMPAQLPRVFERFYRADRGRSREVGGTGLGLAIVKHLARLHGGEAYAVSELGEGTVFTVEFPVCTPPPADPSDD